MEGRVEMSRKEREGAHQVRLCVEGEQGQRDAAIKLRLSVRQVKRLVKRYREEGEAGLCHRSRGRPSNRGYKEGVRGEVLALYRERLGGFGPTLASEKVEEALGLKIDPETIRRWLSAGGMWERHRGHKAHRQWRERKGHFGELVQMDGSFHDWFGNKGMDCLMNMVDDATGTTLGLLSEGETTEAAMVTLWEWIERYGIPCALYTDWKNVYLTTREPTAEEVEAGEAPLTVFGKACAKLGIKIIGASSPQAKGRVERSNAVYQDRFVKELSLRAIRTREGANELLGGSFCDGLNAKFSVTPASESDYHRPVPEGLDPASVFAWEEDRTVAQDWTVRYHNRWLQITSGNRSLPPAKSKVVVQRRLDGTLHLYYRGKEVLHRELPERPKLVSQEAAKPKPGRKTGWTPPADHPWRRPFIAARFTQAALPAGRGGG